MIQWGRATAVALALSWAPACSETAPLEDPPPSEVEPLFDEAAFDTALEEEDEPEPSLIGLTTPEVREEKVVVRGKHARIGLRWSKVRGAKNYEVHVATLLTFQRLAAEKSVKKPRVVLKKMNPGLYYWRVRAVGPAGTSDFSPVQVLNATGNSSRKRKRRRGRPATAEVATEAPAAPEPRLQLAVTKPQDAAVVKTPAVTVEGRATEGAAVMVNTLAAAIENGSFAARVTLKHGRNEVVVAATLGEQNEEVRRDVYYADPRKLAGVRDQFETLRVELQEIRKLRKQLIGMSRSLREQIRDRENQENVAVLQEELKKIQQMSEEVDSEIAGAIEGIEGLLEGP